MSTDTQIQGTVTRDIDWARHHLFLLIAVIVLVTGSVYGIESLLARRAHDQFEQAQAILAQMQKQNEQTQATTQKQIDALTQQNANLQTQLAGLSASIVARDAQLFKDRQDVKTLPPSQLATKWGAAANEAAPTISTNGDFDVPLPLAQKSVDALIQVPVLSKDNIDLKASLTAETQVATNNQTKFEDEQKAHKSDNDACKQTIATKDAEIKDVKAQARKRNILIAIISAVIGYGLHR
jgi:septal ring factor EnvC (AmiA/AmiB activator)